MKLPEQYVVQKFYQYAGFPTFKKYSNVYNACCPSCREGKSWGKKKRLYYMIKDDYLYCQNCSRRWTPIDWIIEQSGMTLQEILKESKNYNTTKNNFKQTEENYKPISNTLPDDSINLFDKQQLIYYKENKVIQDALKLIKHRRLDTAINRPRALFISLKDFVHKNRLIIPFYDINNQIQYYQTREIYKKDEIDRPKYLSKQNAEKTLFGIRNIDKSLDKLLIFEGPIDSMFVKNSIAMGGIALSNHQEEELRKYNLFEKIWVLDNQLNNKDVKKRMQQLVDKGETVFFWPDKFKNYKDLNEICINYELDKVNPKFFIKNAYSGIKALIKLK